MDTRSIAAAKSGPLMTGRDFTFQIGTPFSAAKARMVSQDMPVAIRHVRALIVIGIIR
ncbi:MAG: hypothetical protein ACOYBP_09050 [Microbacteriaceae bacterium]